MAPEWLAALHQVTAALLLCAAVWHAYELRVHPDSLTCHAPGSEPAII